MNDTTAIPQAEPTTGMTGWKTGRATRNAPPPSGGAVYGLGMIGALVYFHGTGESTSDRALAFGKALVWPALLVYKAFQRLGD